MRTYLSSLLIVLTLVSPFLATAEVLGSPSIETKETRSEDSGLENRIRQLDGLQVAAKGPNCWNAALAAAGLASAPRYVSKPEIWHWLQSPYCRQLGNDERPKRGDIASIFWKQWGNYHSYIYLDGNTVFAKEGPDPEDVYKVQSYEGQFRPNYRAEANRCKDLTLNQVMGRSDCDLKTVYHRCTPPPVDFYQRHNSLKEIANQVAEAAVVIQGFLIDQNRTPQVDRAAQTLARALHDLRQRRYSGELEFARKSLEHEVIGLFVSDSYATFSEDVRAAETLADRLQTTERSHVPMTPPIK